MQEGASPRNFQAPNALHTVLRLFVHLRLHFQILLAPIFLWGVLLAGGGPSFTFWIAFVALHLFLYGGTTAFNSYYDRDQGPIGGLQAPPPVTEPLLPFSLAMQGIGLILAFFVNWHFFVIYLLSFLVATAYSWPVIRLKARPVASLIAVGLGQGGVVALAGWVTVQPDLAMLSSLDGWSLLATTLMITGFYPVTQIYQIDEDLARGDLTFAAWLGPRRTLHFAVVVQGVAACLLVWIVVTLLGPIQAALVGLFQASALLFLLFWSARFDESAVLVNYRRVMRLTLGTSGGFLGLLSLHLFGWLP